MAIKAYVGRMGSGKSYEVVSVVILGAIRRGRRVVSNIAGLNFEAMREMLIAEGADAAKLGELVAVEHAQVLLPEFWLSDKDAELGVSAFLQPGDLLVLDEVWRFWEGFADRKMPDRVMNFFRMHRHFVQMETGLTCDVALITQDVLDIARRVRAVIEETYQMTKLTAVGASKRYRVDVHTGGKVSRVPLRSLQRGYEPKFFALYSSHSGKAAGSADAKEENIDGRGNLLSGVLFKVVLPFCVLAFLGAGWMVYRFLHPSEKVAADAPAVDVATKPAAAAGVAVSSLPVPSVSSDWRAAGYVSRGGSVLVLLDGGPGRYRPVASPDAVKFTAGGGIEVGLPEGGFATGYSGGRSGSKASELVGPPK
jgi:zona occludens toxin